MLVNFLNYEWHSLERDLTHPSGDREEWHLHDCTWFFYGTLSLWYGYFHATGIERYELRDEYEMCLSFYECKEGENLATAAEVVRQLCCDLERPDLVNVVEWVHEYVWDVEGTLWDC